MSSERIERTVHLDTSLSREEILRSLYQCGEIRGIYAAGGTGDPARSQYFVEFRDAAKITDLNDLPNVLRDSNPCCISAAPHLVDRFRAVAGPDLPRKPEASVLHNVRSSPYQNSKMSRPERSTKERRRPPTYTTLDPTVTMLPSSHLRKHRAHAPSDEFVDKENRSLALQSSQRRSAESPTTMGEKSADSETEGWAPKSVVLAEAAPWTSSSRCRQTPAPPTPFGADTTAASDVSREMPHRHKFFPAGLSYPDDSPEQVIEALKAVACHPTEYGKWITVAAYYRSKANVAAALAVMSAMSEAIEDTGTDVSCLKPVMLMLSSCHLDMVKQLRVQNGGETAESKSHFDKACAALRRVYGPFVPPPGPATEDSYPLCSSAWRDNQRPITLTPTSKATSSTSEHVRSPTSRYSQVKMLEREVQSLRDRHSDQADALDRARSSKRKVEDDLETERRTRRRLERRLEQVEQDASAAQKGERHALEQCRAEVEARRRADERAEEMRQEAVDVRAELEPKVAEAVEWERRSKEFFGKLGIVFLKAARGELGEVSVGRHLP
ncbi:hypothetical protein OH77DRAFT_1423851 [Trametes cingulata]|nr:hypothetical protein OH77DRAFT_1423851 [Trametes cingulata]